MSSLTIQSPAKLNLNLKILGRDPDGYHRLVTLFHRISLADTLVLRRCPEGFRLRSSKRSLPTGEGNLITKAYRLLQAERPDLPGVSVFLRKRIPVGAGLGGGSSNAAAFLLGMNRLCRLGFSRKKLASLGAKLGADVPFFIYNLRQGMGIGRGDVIRPLPARARHWFVLKTSVRPLETRQVYQNMAGRYKPDSLTSASRVTRMLCAFLEKHRYDRAAALMQNDLEAAAFHLRPSLRSVIAAFSKPGVRTARMSGSGPTVYAILPRSRDAKWLVKKLRAVLSPKQLLICHSY